MNSYTKNKILKQNLSLKLIFLITVIFLQFLPQNIIAQVLNDEIIIVIPNKNTQYMDATNSIKTSLSLKKPYKKVTLLNLSNKKSLESINLNNKHLVVLIGNKSFDFYIKKNAQSPYITSFITQSAFNHIFSKSKQKHNFLGGISIEQPIKRFITLADIILPNLNRLGLVLGPETIRTNNDKPINPTSHNLKINKVGISKNDNPVKKLRSSFESDQALIILPDKRAFNKSISRWVLTLSYQYQKPIITYSKKYVDAGALISLFSSSNQIGKQTAEIVNSFINNPSKRTQKLLSPKYFDIYINKSVSNALKINLPSKEVIIKKLTDSSK